MWMDMIGATGQGIRAGNAEQAKQQVKADWSAEEAGNKRQKQSKLGSTT